MKTIGRQFIETLLTGSIIMTLLCVAIFMKGKSAILHERTAREYAEMAQSTSSYYSLLVSIVLRNDIDELERYMNQVRNEEGLEKAKVITDRREIDLNWKGCQFRKNSISPAVGIPSCYISSNRTLTVMQKLRSGSRTVGIILKSKKIESQSVLSSIVEQPDIFVWVLFVIIFGLYYKKRLHSTVVKPIKRMAEKAKYHERDIEEYNIEEMDCLSKALEESRMVLIERAGMAAIGGMSSHIAHDMRSPLSALKSYIETAPETGCQYEIEDRAIAERSIKKLLRMADDLVDYSKASKIERFPCDVSRTFGNDAIGEIRKNVLEKKSGSELQCSSNDNG